MGVMSDDTESAQPPPRRPPLADQTHPHAAMVAMAADHEKHLTSSERAMRDIKIGLGPMWDNSTVKMLRDVRLAGSAIKVGLPDDYFQGLVSSMNTATASALKGISPSALAFANSGVSNALAGTVAKLNATALAGITPSLGRINATALAAVNAQVVGSLDFGALFTATRAASVIAASTIGLSKFRTDQFLPPGTLAALQATQLSAMRFDVGAMTDRPAGVLGRFDAALHLDAGLGAAVDSLIAAPSRRGPVGFNYGDVQRRAREVDEALSESPASAQLVEAVEEAQDATGLDYEVMFDFSQFLGIPAPRRPGSPSAAAILFVSTIGSTCVVYNVAAGRVQTLSDVLGALVIGTGLWALLRKFKDDNKSSDDE